MTMKWNPSSSQVVTKHDSVITIHDGSDYYILRQHVITIYDGYVITIHNNCYYNSRQVLQFTTLLHFTTAHMFYTVNSHLKLNHFK